MEAYRYLLKGWVDHYYTVPQYHFTYPFFGWIEPWPGGWMHAHFYVLGLLGLMIAAGAAYRVATTLFFLDVEQHDDKHKQLHFACCS